MTTQTTTYKPSKEALELRDKLRSIIQKQLLQLGINVDMTLNGFLKPIDEALDKEFRRGQQN